MQTAGGNRLRPVANHLAARQQVRYEWMRLEALELGVRIDQRIAIIKPGHVAEIQNAILHPVNPAAAIGPLIGGKAKRVRNSSGRITIIRKLPKFLDTQTVNLWLASFVEAQPLNKLFGQRTAHAFTQHRDLRAQIDTGLEIRFALPFLADSFVAGAHADHAVAFVVQQLGAGKFRENVDAGCFALLAQPGGQAI